MLCAVVVRHRRTSFKTFRESYNQRVEKSDKRNKKTKNCCRRCCSSYRRASLKTSWGGKQKNIQTEAITEKNRNLKINKKTTERKRKTTNEKKQKKTFYFFFSFSFSFFLFLFFFFCFFLFLFFRWRAREVASYGGFVNSSRCR